MCVCVGMRGWYNIDPREDNKMIGRVYRVCLEIRADPRVVTQ